VSLVGPRPLPERDYAMLEDWHRNATWCCRHHRAVAGLRASELDFDDLVHLDFIYSSAVAGARSDISEDDPRCCCVRGAY